MCFTAVQLFPLTFVTQAIIIWPSALVLGYALKKRAISRQYSRTQAGYRTLLAYLSTRLSTGETLERAIISSPSSLTSELSGQQEFLSDLGQVARRVEWQPGQLQLLSHLAEKHPWPAVKPILTVLPTLQKLGGQVGQFIRQSHQMLAELAALERDVRDEQSQQAAEAFVLALMPFLLALSLYRAIDPQMLKQLRQESMSQLILGGLCWLAILTLSLNLTIDLDHPPRQRRDRAKPGHPASSPIRTPTFVLLVSLWLEKLYRLSFLTEVTLQLFTSLSSSAVQHRRYFQNKLLFMMIGIVLAIIWFASGQLPFWLLILSPVFISALQDYLYLQKARHLVNQYRLDFPLLMNWQVHLLSIGFTVVHTLQLSSDGWSWEQLSADPRVVSGDLALFKQALLAGQPVDQALEHLADRAPLSEIRAYYHTLARYEREGQPDLLNRLAEHAHNSFALLRSGRRHALNQRSFARLSLMMLDLIIIIGLTLWPSIRQLL